MSRTLAANKASPQLLSKLKSFRNCLVKEREIQDEADRILKEVSNPITALRLRKERILDQPEVPPTNAGILTFEKLPWKLLPSGQNGLKLLIKHFRKIEKRGSWNGKVLDISRLSCIENRLRPSYCYLGEDGFEGYVAYCFRQTKRIVLESPVYGNASYILKDNWKTISKLSKWEARQEHSNDVIVVRHNESWFERLRLNLEIYY